MHASQRSPLVKNQLTLSRPFLCALLAYATLFRLLPYLMGQLGYTVESAMKPVVWNIPLLGSITVQTATGMEWFPWNFSPVIATTLFLGAGVGALRGGGIVMLIVYTTDWLIGALAGRTDWNYSLVELSVQLAVIATYGLIALLGGWNLSRGLGAMKAPPLYKTWGTALAAEVVFFVITNFACFVAYEGYPRTPAGLAACYLGALPYFGRGLLGTLVYSSLLFSPLGLTAAGLLPNRLAQPVSTEQVPTTELAR